LPSVNVRLSDQQHALLRTAAYDARRSLQAEILSRLFNGTLTERERAFAPAENEAPERVVDAPASTTPPRSASVPETVGAEPVTAGAASGGEDGVGAAVGSGGVPSVSAPATAALAERVVAESRGTDGDARRPVGEGDSRTSSRAKPSAARKGRGASSGGMCEHRVPAGTFCKKCGMT
jgi:hypothetical protein